MSLHYVRRNDKNFERDFLRLPALLYSRDKLMQSCSEEKKLLENRHILSGYFKIHPILVRNGDRPASRGAVTVYPDDKTAYFGFFESIKSSAAAQMIFSRAEKIALSCGCERLVGPVDASFWIKYRLKVNRFDIPPYAGEPYNKSYYEEYFRKAGFVRSELYKSVRFGKMTAEGSEEIFSRRLKDKLAEGYEIRSPKPQEFLKSLREVYRLLIDLYSDFPAYKFITEEEFVSIYGGLKYLLDYSMVKLCYKDGETVGFYISVPNYGNLSAGRLSPDKLVKLLKIRKDPKDYVMLYMGISPKHHGMGKAVTEAVRRELVKNGASSVGALIRSGKINGGYYSSQAKFEYEYALFEKIISDM